MLVATFRPSTAWAGRTVTYDDGVFVLEGHGRIPTADLLTYDALGQLTWAYDGLREWVKALLSAPPTAPPIGQQPITAAREVDAPGVTPGVVPEESAAPAGSTSSDARERRPRSPPAWVLAVAGGVVVVAALAAVLVSLSGTPHAVVVTDHPPSVTASPTGASVSPVGFWQERLDGKWSNIIRAGQQRVTVKSTPLKAVLKVVVSADEGYAFTFAGNTLTARITGSPAVILVRNPGGGGEFVGTFVSNDASGNGVHVTYDGHELALSIVAERTLAAKLEFIPRDASGKLLFRKWDSVGRHDVVLEKR